MQNTTDDRPYKYGDSHPFKPGYTFHSYRHSNGRPTWESAESKTKRLARSAALRVQKDREDGVPERRVGRDVEKYKAYQVEFRKTEAWKASQKKWYEANKADKFEARKQRRKEDPIFKCRVWAGNQNQRIKEWMVGGVSPRRGSLDRLGCTAAELKVYLEARFLPGMTWENYGEWHIDHVVPLASAKTPEQIQVLCHYRNLQPLWAEDNLRKSDQLHP